MSDVIALKGGFITTNPRLDRVPEFDERSRDYPIRTLVTKKKLRSMTWRTQDSLDQGREGRCVEYSICNDLLARPGVVDWAVVQSILDGKLIYWPAQREDQWDGGSYPGAQPVYEGTSVLSGVGVASKLGLYGEYRWAFTLEDALLGILIGPLLLGINWYAGMSTPDEYGWIKASGTVDGGHAIMASASRLVKKSPGPLSMENLDLDLSYITLHNSWGSRWGDGGNCYLSVRDFDKVRMEDGEVCIVTKRLRPKSVKPILEG